MQTLKLRKLQQPSAVDELLESYVEQANFLPGGSYQIRNRRDIPKELSAVLSHAIKNGRAWSCRSHTFRTWLFTCEMSLPLSRERGTPVLQVNLYGDDGGLKDSGTWIADRQHGKWRRCAD